MRLSLSFALMILIAAPNLKVNAITRSNAVPQVDEPPKRTLQKPLRVALIGFAPSNGSPGSRAIESALFEALAQDQRVSLIDDSIIKPALTGIGYGGSINMSKDEARRLGSAIGCDFFIIGKTESLTRSRRENESHEETFAGVMIIDARTGAMASFDFISEAAAAKATALNRAIKMLNARAAGYVDRIVQLRESSQTESSTGSAGNSARLAPAETIEDIPEEGSARAAGFNPPEFINRVKPEYTREAEQADIKATVEAMVVFRLNGEVGRIEITRWAGFGLEESSERAIRQLKFKPAERDGKPVSVRALVRYTFRRVAETNSTPQQPAPEASDKPERDLRQLFKPNYRRPQ